MKAAVLLFFAFVGNVIGVVEQLKKLLNTADQFSNQGEAGEESQSLL